MASNFPAHVTEGAEHTTVRDYAVGTAFIPGSFVVWDTTNHDMDVCGADPVLIAGISEVNSTAAALLTPDSKVPVRIITSDQCIIALGSATTPAASYIGDALGIVLSTNWLVDTSETTNVRVIVMDVDITNGIWYCNIVPLALQFGPVGTALS